MNSLTDSAARPEASPELPSEPDERFTVRDPQEMRFVLRRIQENGQSITAYIDGGPDFVLTFLLSVQPEFKYLVLERGPDGPAFKRLLRASRALLVTSHEQVKVKFFVRDMRQIVHEGRAALRAAMPPWLLRIQRREHFRIATPIARPILCTVFLNEETPDLQADAVILDLSIGGVALMDNNGALRFRLGERHQGCRIALPETGNLTVDLEVRSVYETPLRNGRSFRRCGCKFINLQPAAESMIQRYIMQLELKRIGRG